MSRVLMIAGLLAAFTVGPLRSGTIAITPGETPADVVALQVTDIANLAPINLGATPFSLSFHNGTGVTFTDLHFVASIAQPTPITGNGDGFFHNFIGTTTTADFFSAPGDPGIPTSTAFTVTATGFVAGTTITMTPTVPEPASVVLFSCGAVFLFVYEWRRRRVRRHSL